MGQNVSYQKSWIRAWIFLTYGLPMYLQVSLTLKGSSQDIHVQKIHYDILKSAQNKNIFVECYSLGLHLVG